MAFLSHFAFDLDFQGHLEPIPDLLVKENTIFDPILIACQEYRESVTRII